MSKETGEKRERNDRPSGVKIKLPAKGWQAAVPVLLGLLNTTHGNMILVGNFKLKEGMWNMCSSRPTKISTETTQSIKLGNTVQKNTGIKKIDKWTAK